MTTQSMTAENRPDWPARARQSREQQWALAQELLKNAMNAKDPQVIERFIELRAQGMNCTQPPTPFPILDSNFTAVKSGPGRKPTVSRVQAIYRQLVTRFITSNFTACPQLQAVKFGKV